ncbi:hypothetical protein K457DRAFT_417485 [Linnemannia elongata AG-77]|uniref:Uncharacterized protein n=1 Tax=Linnemannia elongata AG-77 TaxID=1314771 RepID=A0A197K0J0_9FUNG|nr:hypothetical protein K457DRAFT_417485 [Linnemannia elongata AG-77]
MSTTTPFTIIPSSQPSCGDITPSQPIPHCPNTNTTANSSSGNPNGAGEPMGCFFQTNGLFCAPLSTTRGFLLTLNSTQQQQQQQLQRNSFWVPFLSTATNDNTTNPSPPLLGVDGKPVNYRGPARLGETCYPIPLPPATDPLFQTLVTVANQRLNETLSWGGEATTPTPGGGGGGGSRSPGVGAGVQVFNFRGDCEQGSYCDFVPPPVGAVVAVGVTGICKEVLPNFHTCSSYAQCSSLRCGQPWSEGGGGGVGGGESRNSTTDNTGVTVCLPSKLDRGNTNNNGGGGPGGGGKGDDKPNKFPAWIGGIIAIVVVFGAAIIFGLVRRKKKMAADKEKKSMKKRRRSARSQTAAAAAGMIVGERDRDRERRRTTSLPLHSQHPDQQQHGGDGDDKESDYVYQLHSAEPSLMVNEKQGLSSHERSGSGGGFGSWFRRSRTENQMDKEQGDLVVSRATRNNSSSTRGSFPLDSKEAESAQHQQAGSPTGGHIVALNTLREPTTTAENERSTGSIHSDSTTAVVLDSAATANQPRSRMSVNIPKIVTTPSSDPTAAAPPRTYAEGEEHDIATGLSYSKNLNNRPSFSSATSSLPSSATESSPPSSNLSRRSSSHAFLGAASTSTPPPGSPVSPISPISPRPPLSSAPSSRSSQRQSLQASSASARRS